MTGLNVVFVCDYMLKTWCRLKLSVNLLIKPWLIRARIICAPGFFRKLTLVSCAREAWCVLLGFVCDYMLKIRARMIYAPFFILKKLTFGSVSVQFPLSNPAKYL